MSDFNYDKAEADLYDSGCPYSEEIFEYKSDRGRNEFLRENGLDPSKYYNDGGAPGGSSDSPQSGCFLTTACVASRGLPDNCDELETLRAFRDSFMQSTEEMRLAVRKYYEIAPSVVSAIEKRADRISVWNEIYNELIVPCVNLIKQCRFEETYQLYRRFTEKLAEEYK